MAKKPNKTGKKEKAPAAKKNKKASARKQQREKLPDWGMLLYEVVAVDRNGEIQDSRRVDKRSIFLQDRWQEDYDADGFDSNGLKWIITPVE